MLKNLSLIALLGIAAVGVPSELCAKSVMVAGTLKGCLLYTSPSPRDRQKSRMPSSA